MATPPIVPHRYPFLEVDFLVDATWRRVEALLDTGFDGGLALPADSLDDFLTLPAEWRSWRLADGSTIWAPSYEATFRVGVSQAFRGRITVLGDEPLIGREVIDRFSVTFDHGRQVVIKE